MKTSDLKYLLAWLIPVFGWAGLHFQSWLSPGSFYLSFIIVPIAEIWWKGHPDSIAHLESNRRCDARFFDLLLYLNLPMLYTLLFYFLGVISQTDGSSLETFFLVLNMGLMMGVMGINVAHELGHRSGKLESITAPLLLLPSCYMHFTREHNYWHHKYVATAEDPSSARRNEPVFRFWLRSISGSYMKAVEIEKRRLANAGKSFLNWSNKLFLQAVIQIAFLMTVCVVYGWMAFAGVLGAAAISVLLLETINYIEHYGLSRSRREDGRYEKIGRRHSWNSNHVLGRILLYELTRHPHHHENSSIKYQNLKCLEDGPQMPLGYPASLMMSLCPQLWFKYMNPRLPEAECPSDSLPSRSVQQEMNFLTHSDMRQDGQ